MNTAAFHSASAWYQFKAETDRPLRSSYRAVSSARVRKPDCLVAADRLENDTSAGSSARPR